MTSIQIGLVGLGVLTVLLALRMPIGLALIATSFGGLTALVGPEIAFRLLSSSPYQFAAGWTLSSIPMFLLMGFIAHHSGMIEGLFRFARILLARLPGGLACAGVAGAASFAAVSGSSLATAAAMGRIAIPEMLRYKYDPALATGSLAAAGTIGALIPPSIIMIIYAIFAMVPISKLFLAGLVIGVLTAIIYISVIVTRVLINPRLAEPFDGRLSYSDLLQALRETFPTVALIAIVFGGLFGGIFTATEAGGVGAAMAIVIALLMQRLTWSSLLAALKESAITSASLFIIAIGANLLTRYMALSGATDYLSELLSFANGNDLVLLFIISLIFLVLGMFLEPIGAMLLTMPVILPVVEGAGIDLIFFGIFLLKLLEIGMLTPPIGMNVFVIRSVAPPSISLSTIFRGVLWFVIADLILLVVLALFPEIISIPVDWLA